MAGARIVLTLMLAASALGFVSHAGGQAAPAAPLFKFVVDRLVVEAGKADGQGTMVLEAANIGEGVTAAVEEPTDLGPSEPPPSNIVFTAKDLQGDAAARRWLLTAKVSGLSGKVSQTRYLSFRFDGHVYTLPYTLTNDNGGAFSWSIAAPAAELSLRTGEPIEIAVAIKKVATKVQLMQAVFVEETTKSTIEGGWILCATRAGDDCKPDQPIPLAADSANRLWLLPANAGTSLIGKYDGTVTIGASEDPEGKSFTLKIFGTSPLLQAFGVLAILAGVVVAWFASTWSQNTINRDQMLLPISALDERTRKLTQRLAVAPKSFATHIARTLTALAGLTAEAIEKDLTTKGLLPGSLPSPFRAAPDVAAYKTVLTADADRVAFFEVLVGRGFDRLWVLAGNKPDDPALIKACDDLDQLSESKLTAENAAATIDPIIANASPAVASGVAEARAMIPQVRTVEQLTLEIGRVSMMVWLVFALLATLVGTYVLVLKPGFGLATDFLMCVAWGFGLPAAGQQFSQSTVANVSTALGITKVSNAV